MKVTEKEIKHLASLSRLEFNEDEISNFIVDLNSIIEYVDQLQKIDTSNIVDNTTIKNFEELRDDEVKESLPNNEIVGNAPKNKDGYFIAPTVVE